MKTALITGGAQRIGAQITKTLHKHGFDVIIHYRHSKQAASSLMQSLNQKRTHSARILQAELSAVSSLQTLVKNIENLDILINNASVFYPTPINKVSQQAWHQIISTNLMAPFFFITIISSNFG